MRYTVLEVALGVRKIRFEAMPMATREVDQRFPVVALSTSSTELEWAAFSERMKFCATTAASVRLRTPKMRSKLEA